MPVLTGIGHERDSTILDEVAHRRFDTPSKVAHHITQAVRDNALAALADLERIGHLVRRILAVQEERLAGQEQRIEARVRLALASAEATTGRLEGEIRGGSAHQIESASQLLGRAQERLRLAAERGIERADVQVAEAWRSVEQGTGLAVERRAATIDQAAQAVALNSTRHLELLVSRLDRDRERVARTVSHRVTLATSQLGDAVAQLARATEAVRRDAGLRIESFVQRIVGLGPEATLRRGYAIVRDRDGRPLGTRRRAKVEPILQFEFHDARMRVENNTLATGPRS